MKNKDSLFLKNKNGLQLEDLLDQKNYTDEAKGLISNIIFKIDNAYKDYRNIKHNVKQKSEIIEDIVDTIEHRCDVLEILDPEKKQAKLYVDRRKKTIKTFPNEIDLLQAIYYIKTPYGKKIQNIFEKAVVIILEKGMSINGVEIIRDFNGWSWNNSLNNDNSQYYNIIYQSLVMLIGELELENITKGSNIIENISNTLEELYGETKSNDLVTKLFKACLLLYISNSETNLEEVELYLKSKKELYYKLKNKSKFIKETADQNTEDTKIISNIDAILSSEALLKKMYSSKNLSKKYENIEIYRASLVQHKKYLLEKISEMKKMMNPFEYIKIKERTEIEIKNLNDVIVSSSANQCIYTSLIELQKIVIECFYKKIEIYELKKELVGLVYEIRYYNNIPIEDKKVGEIKELKNNLDAMQRELVNKLCTLKVIDRFSPNDSVNYEILKHIFKSRKIHLSKITVKLTYKVGILRMQYYDENDIEFQNFIKISDDDYKNINKKTDKKIKIFI